jgi:hypothetical protein
MNPQITQIPQMKEPRNLQCVAGTSFCDVCEMILAFRFSRFDCRISSFGWLKADC